MRHSHSLPMKVDSILVNSQFLKYNHSNCHGYAVIYKYIYIYILVQFLAYIYICMTRMQMQSFFAQKMFLIFFSLYKKSDHPFAILQRKNHLQHIQTFVEFNNNIEKKKRFAIQFYSCEGFTITIIVIVVVFIFVFHHNFLSP